MEYTIHLRCFLNLKRKEKAQAHAERLFPGLPLKIVGRYWKDDNLWECVGQRNWEFSDDKSAVWETLTYFGDACSQWTLIVGPNSHYEIVIAAIANQTVDAGMTWAHFQLFREEVPKEGGAD